jgi:hypothetical protein
MKLNLAPIFLMICLVFSVQANAQLAYKPGEVLKFKVKYGWFKTSEATLKVYDTNLNGIPVYRIHGHGRTTGMLDWFFRVRDNFESFIDQKNHYPLKFIRNTDEGGYTKNKMIRFQHNKDSAIVHDYKHDKISKHYIEKRTQDMISAFYTLRNQVDEDNLVKGQVFNLNLFFDEENFGFRVEYLGEEVIETEFGEVRTIVFRPYVQADRVFKEEESVTIWVSKDQNKIPLKIEAELAVGSITATLDKYKNLAYPFTSQLSGR